MATTYRQFAYSILEHLNKTKDDADINILHVLYWTKLCANRIAYDSVKKDTKEESFYLVQTEVNLLEKPNGKKYFTLPVRVFNLYKNRGISDIFFIEEDACDTSIKFSRATAQSFRTLYLDDFTRPSLENPYFYQVGEEVMLLGLECTDIKKLNVLLVSPIAPNDTCSLDDELNFPEEKMELLYRSVIDLCKFKLIAPSDIRNDGSDTSSDKNDYAIAYSKDNNLAQQAQQQ